MKIEKMLRHIGEEKMRHALRIQTTLLKSIQQFMIAHGFVEFMPVITSPLTDPLGPDQNSSVIKTGEIKYYGQKLVLTQSMIIHKQLAVAAGLEKIFVFSPNVRLEDRKRRFTGRHLFEFTQMDFEIKEAEMEDVFDVIEDLAIYVMKMVLKERKEDLEFFGRRIKIPRKPFKIYTSHELEEKYGKDWESCSSKAHKEPFWVICHKREFYDKEDEQHPGHYRNYDLIWPEGFGEALSGGEREFEYEKIKRRIAEAPARREMFKNYILLAKKGLLVPSAGGGIGVERFLRFLTGCSHIKEIQPFMRVPGERVFF